jgi:hypothetical protein
MILLPMTNVRDLKNLEGIRDTNDQQTLVLRNLMELSRLRNLKLVHLKTHGVPTSVSKILYHKLHLKGSSSLQEFQILIVSTFNSSSMKLDNFIEHITTTLKQMMKGHRVQES